VQLSELPTPFIGYALPIKYFYIASKSAFARPSLLLLFTTATDCSIALCRSAGESMGTYLIDSIFLIISLKKTTIFL
jgi:hypothetical protein